MNKKVSVNPLSRQIGSGDGGVGPKKTISQGIALPWPLAQALALV